MRWLRREPSDEDRLSVVGTSARERLVRALAAAGYPPPVGATMDALAMEVEGTIAHLVQRVEHDTAVVADVGRLRRDLERVQSDHERQVVALRQRVAQLEGIRADNASVVALLQAQAALLEAGGVVEREAARR